MLFKKRWRNKLYGECNSKWYKNDIIEITKYRDEIRYQVNRTKSISRHTRRSDLGVPGYSGITGGQPEGYNISFENTRPLSESLKDIQCFVFTAPLMNYGCQAL